MVIKFSNDYLMLANEIKAFKRISIKANSSKQVSPGHIGVPEVIKVGIFTVIDPHPEEANKKESIPLSKGNVANLFGWYIMPKYQMSVQDFLEQSFPTSSIHVPTVLKIM
jgi:hypothetical protein